MQPNRLAREKSPYLLQHARNPVDWYPWGDEAFVEAARTDRPVFLSIGYATCHWCHVMERESFENAAVAAVLNRHFVSVKVDREERPDIDQVYMTVCQMLTGRGGWPLTLLLTPDRRPFFAATYLPRESRPGQTGLLDLLPRVVDLWRADRERLLGSADQIVEALRKGATADLSGEAPETDLLDRAAAEYAARFDPMYGGFGGAPKFPSPHNLTFLLRHGRRSGEADASEMVFHTLDHMRRGGLFDQIGFGFHRYSTDERWLVPHFEKMLYDQAGLAVAYLEAWQASGETRHRDTAQQVLAYVKRDLTSPEGGFYSAEDADSEGEEGRYYLWRLGELNDVLPEEDRVFAAEAYGFRPEGNYRDESTGRRTGANIPILAADGRQASRDPVRPVRLETVRERLLSARGNRVRPLLDDKVMTDWNGLMIGAFARAAWTLEDASYLDTARRAADFVLECLRDGEGRLQHRWREGEAGLPAHLDDYAFLVHGLIELYQASFEARYLFAAIDLNHQMILLFEDPQGGFTFTSVDRDPLLARLKETYDGAHPSGNSVALHNLVRLSRLTGKTEWDDVAHRTMGALAEPVRLMPTGHGHFLSGIALALGASLEIVIAGEPDREDTRELLSVLRRAYLPHAVLHVRHTGNRDALAGLAPYTAKQEPIDGRATAYVCRSFACEQPTTRPSELHRLLAD